MNIELPTGKTLQLSIYEFLFLLKDEDVDNFYQSAIADDLGTYVENPFSNRSTNAKLDVEEMSEIEDLGEDISI